MCDSFVRTAAHHIDVLVLFKLREITMVISILFVIIVWYICIFIFLFIFCLAYSLRIINPKLLYLTNVSPLSTDMLSQTRGVVSRYVLF